MSETLALFQKMRKAIELFHPAERTLQREKIRGTPFRVLDWLRDIG